MQLQDDRYCFACGAENKHGLGLKFTIDKSNVIHTEFTFQKHHQGFKDIVHGGLIGLVLDEVMVNLPWKLGKKVVSAELNIRLNKPAKVGQKLFFKGWIEEEASRMIYARADAKDESGAVIATASAKCVKVK